MTALDRVTSHARPAGSAAAALVALTDLRAAAVALALADVHGTPRQECITRSLLLLADPGMGMCTGTTAFALGGETSALPSPVAAALLLRELDRGNASPTAMALWHRWFEAVAALAPAAAAAHATGVTATVLGVAHAGAFVRFHSARPQPPGCVPRSAQSRPAAFTPRWVQTDEPQASKVLHAFEHPLRVWRLQHTYVLRQHAHHTTDWPQAHRGPAAMRAYLQRVPRQRRERSVRRRLRPRPCRTRHTQHSPTYGPRAPPPPPPPHPPPPPPPPPPFLVWPLTLVSGAPSIPLLCGFL